MKEMEPGRRRAGFTLVEILVVVCIITILIGLTANAAFSAQQKAHKATATQECEQIAAAFKSYWLAHQSWPGSPWNNKNGVDWTPLDKSNLEILRGKDGVVYLDLNDDRIEEKDQFLDPWGHPYRVKIDKEESIVLEDAFEAVVSFPNQFSRYYDVAAPYME